MIPVATLWHYFKTRQLVFNQRQALEAYQQKQLKRFINKVLTKSRYFQPFCHQPFSQWPMMDKTLMMAEFDNMNSAGLKKEQLLACAMQSEAQRDFSQRINQFSVGLSSGTSGQRGLFVVSQKEQQIWAGSMLAKMLPDGITAGERVALFLRADNHLYHSVNTPWLSLRFFDLFAPFISHFSPLADWQPTIIVAPAQVLRELALAVLAEKLVLKVKKVISVAEVLEPFDKQLLQQVFGCVGEVYQATEGFLAATCEQGTLHLNEEFVYIEPQWIDEQRFIPIVTDFTRTTQPIVRYRLDDLLVKQSTPCPCGRVTLPIARIEGRCDDWLELPNKQGGTQIIFADLCSRILANHLPLSADYRLVQHGSSKLVLSASCAKEQLVHCCTQLTYQLAQHGVDVVKLQWQLMSGPIPLEFALKRRRIMRIKEESR